MGEIGRATLDRLVAMWTSLLATLVLYARACPVATRGRALWPSAGITGVGLRPRAVAIPIRERVHDVRQPVACPAQARVRAQCRRR
jgi:hypothetical protein